jgi:cytochrome c553
MGQIKTVLLGVTACASVWLIASFDSHGATPEPVPYWAYAVNPPSATPPATATAGTPAAVPVRPATPAAPPPPSGPVTLPGSKLVLPAPPRDLNSPPDWYPQEHAPMPTIVSQGRKPAVFACGYCHLPTGDGRIENAPIAGLPEAYFLEQMANFKSGARNSSVRRGPFNLMINVAKAATDEEIAEAAAYFSKQKPVSHLKVVETATVPKTIAKGSILQLDPAGGREPIGERIIETPDSIDLFELRDSHVPVTAWVPPGSVAKGRAIATGRNGQPETACVTCHGAKLEGVGAIPGLAGRSPSYIVRQLYDFRTGARGGDLAAPMKTVAERLDTTGMVQVAAYAGSLK